MPRLLGPGRRRHALATVALFVVALVVLAVEASGSPFEADESDYVATSRYFGYLVLQRNVSRDEWGSNHWTRTQPPLTRYIVGGWLTAYGYDLEKMNQPYVSTASSFEVNRQKGRVPTDDVLARSRQPMVLLGAGALALLYPLGLLLGGPLAGLLAVGLALSSPFMRYTLVHTWAEAPLAFFLLLALLLAALGVRRLTREHPSTARWPLWALGLGLAVGLASATKLTGLVGIPVVLGAASLPAVKAWRAGDRPAARRLALWAGGAALVAGIVFVGVNPYLWRGPVAGLVGMLEERRDEMAFQQSQWPEYAVTNPLDRPRELAIGATRVGPWAEWPALAVPIGLLLAALGLAITAHRLVRGEAGTAALVQLCWLGGYTVAILAGLGLNYPRYFMPVVLPLLPFLGLGAALLVGGAFGLIRPSGTGRLSVPASARAR